MNDVLVDVSNEAYLVSKKAGGKVLYMSILFAVIIQGFPL